MRVTLLLISILFAMTSYAETQFEGFFRIEKDGKHVGYAIQRLAADSVTRTQTLTTYVRMRMPDNKEYFESFKSVAAVPSLAPLQTHYRGDMSGMYVDVQAKFKGNAVVVERRANKSAKPYRVINTKLATKRPFLSSYLFYISDFGALKSGKNYMFDTFIDREGVASPGNLSVASEKSAGSLRHFQLVVDTSADPAESFVTDAGYPLGSRSTTQNFVSYWVSKRQDAVGQFEFPNNEVISLFGDLPEGQKNPWSKIPQFDARAFIAGFPKSTGARKLSKVERKKISVQLPFRAPAATPAKGGA